MDSEQAVCLFKIGLYLFYNLILKIINFLIQKGKKNGYFMEKFVFILYRLDQYLL